MNMVRLRYILSILVTIILLASCTSAKNTRGTRWYHAFNTRYNVYFNGKLSFDEAAKAQLEGYQDNFSETILMFPVSATPDDKANTGGPFDKTIEKSVKAIKQHSIQTKPEKDPKRRNDPKYQEFMNRTEYNPFLYNAWLLLGRSQFQNGDFLQAASTFSYTSRMYSTQPEIYNEAKMWHARAFAEMEWYFESQDILDKLDKETFNKDLDNLFATVQADLLIKQKKYEEAVPFMQVAIKAEKNKFQKAREKYLLGQMYTNLGENDLAYKTFGEISSSSAPYVMEFNAKIRQTEVAPWANVEKSIKQLNRMAKNHKNKDYLDQVYYALGNIYMSMPDTTKAIASYERGVEESTRQGIDKALNQIRLGDIYFQTQDYVKAQPNYSEALAQLKKGDDAYPRVSKRAEVLDELVIYHEEVVLQDSLQRLAGMSEEEQLAVVEAIIEKLIKEEEEAAKAAEREEFIAQRDAERNVGRPTGPPAGAAGMVSIPGQEGLFYFYNQQMVAMGKSAFQQKWGKRKLEDDWRRRDKASLLYDNLEEPLEEDLLADADSTLFEPQFDEDGNPIEPQDDVMGELSSDPKDPQFYLQQIPKTEEDFEASNLLIIDGLYNMGLIYKDKLEDKNLALSTFEELDTRFPENENKLESYYHTYLIYLRDNDMDNANLTKAKIIDLFPNSAYAVAMSDPDYEYNLRMIDIVQDSIYQTTYEAYIDGNIQDVRDNYELVSTKYNQSKLMPKFMFLNALTYVQENDAERFKEELKAIIDKYPDADVSVLASEMMKGFQRGLLLSTSGDGMLARGSLFNIRFTENEMSEEQLAEIQFSAEPNVPYELVLIYPSGILNDNLLLYTVADFNFSNFRLTDFDLSLSSVNEINMFQIQGFKSLEEVLQYYQMIHGEGAYARELGVDVVILPISVDNYDKLMKGKSVEEYMSFFEENFSKGNENIIAKWNLSKEAELEEAELEEKELIEEAEEKEEEILEEEKEKETIPAEQSEETIVIEEDTIESKPVEKEEDSITEEPYTTVGATARQMEEQAEEVISQAEELFDNVSSTLDEIAADPIRAIGNLFKRKKTTNAIDEYVKQQEKEEKERRKQIRAEQREAEKQALLMEREKEKQEKELLKAQKKEEREAEKLRKAEIKQAEKLKKLEQKAKEEAKKNVKKEKELEKKLRDKERKEAQKLKEQQRKETQKLREEERREREALRKEEQKIKERERKEAQKLKEQERKAREKERKEEQKRKQAEKKNK